jgi:hypothetical protein
VPPAGPDRPSTTHRCRRRALALGAAILVALAASGCGEANNGSSDGSAGSSAAPLVTGEQVVTACFHAYFYNGILPKTAAQANCQSCVVDQLRKLGVQPSSGENVADMLTGDRLASSAIQTLQSTCDVSDANSQ